MIKEWKCRTFENNKFS